MSHEEMEHLNNLVTKNQQRARQEQAEHQRQARRWGYRLRTAALWGGWILALLMMMVNFAIRVG